MGKVNVGRLMERMAPALERRRREEAQKAYEREQARLRELEEKRQAEYNKPLPEFAPKVARETRVRLLTYVAKVFNDAVRKTLLEDADNVNRYSWYYGQDRVDTNFEDRPVQEFSVAIRVAELNPIRGSSRVDQFGVLYVRHESHGDEKRLYLAGHYKLQRRVCYRLKENLFKNLPILEQTLGKQFDVRMGVPFDELKKSGYKAEPGEQRVVHLEIF